MRFQLDATNFIVRHHYGVEAWPLQSQHLRRTAPHSDQRSDDHIFGVRTPSFDRMAATLKPCRTPSQSNGSFRTAGSLVKANLVGVLTHAKFGDCTRLTLGMAYSFGWLTVLYNFIPFEVPTNTTLPLPPSHHRVIRAMKRQSPSDGFTRLMRKMDNPIGVERGYSLTLCICLRLRRYE